MEKAVIEKEFEYAKTRSISPLVSSLTDNLDIELSEAKKLALSSREGKTFEDFWKGLDEFDVKNVASESDEEFTEESLGGSDKEGEPDSNEEKDNNSEEPEGKQQGAQDVPDEKVTKEEEDIGSES